MILETCSYMHNLITRLMSCTYSNQFSKSRTSSNFCYHITFLHFSFK